MTLLPDVERALTRALADHIAHPAARSRRRWTRRAAVLALTAALIGSASAVGAAAGLFGSLRDAVERGDTPVAPQADRELPLVGDDGRRALAAYRGRVLVVTFLASWCAPCRQEARLVDDAGARLRADGRGSALLIATSDGEPYARAFVARYGLRLPVLGDPDGSVAAAYGVRAIPATFVLDADGKVVAVRDGMHLDRAALAADIAKALP